MQSEGERVAEQKREIVNGVFGRGNNMKKRREREREERKKERERERTMEKLDLRPGLVKALLPKLNSYI